MKKFIYCLLLLIFLGCNKSEENISTISHINDNINLQLYDVALGDDIEKIYKQFPMIKNIPYDSIEDYSHLLPYTYEEGQVFKELGISLLVTDTIFVSNHENYQHTDENGFNIYNFPYNKLSHKAAICYMIKNKKVYQCDLFIFLKILDYDLDLTIDNLIGPIKGMFYDKYNTPDSVLMINRVTKNSVFVGYNKDEEYKDKIRDILEHKDIGNTIYVHSITYDQDVWTWDNAKIYADWYYTFFKNKEQNKFLSDGVMKISYIDYATFKKEKEALINDIRKKEKEDSINVANAINAKQLQYNKMYNKQNF